MKIIPPKSVRKYGLWVEKKTLSIILPCALCGGKYIKTRLDQKHCVRCMHKS